ncbi:hypothetical protein RI367_001772 [Sorochytrium milnesiophthora]
MQLQPQVSFELAGAELLLSVHNARLSLLSDGTTATVGRGCVNVYGLSVTPQSHKVAEMTVLAMPLDVIGDDNTSLAASMPQQTFQLQLTEDLHVVKQGASAFLFPAASDCTFYKIDFETKDAEEIEALEDLLAHYTGYQLASKDYRNTLALVDSKGHVVGKLAEDVHIDATRVNQYETGPVLINVQNSQDASKPPVITVKSTTGEQMVQKSEQLGELLVRGAIYLGSGIVKAGQGLKPMLTPKQTPTAISPTTKTRIGQAKQVTSVALKATQMAVTGATFLAGQVGSVVAQKLKENPRTSGPKSSTVIKFSEQLIQSIGTLSSSVSQSGRIVLRSVGVQAVDLVSHVYGTDAGAVVNDVASLGEQLWVVYFDARGIRRMAFMTGVKGTINSMHNDPSPSTTAATTYEALGPVVADAQSLAKSVQEAKKKQQ